MRTPYLILDCNYLAYRAFFSTGGGEGFSYNGRATGVTYGFLRDLRKIMDDFASDKVLLCFDHGKPIRKDMYPNYKSARHSKPLSKKDELAFIAMKEQVELLKTQYLKEIGFKNVLYRKGYEADDLIAFWSARLSCHDLKDVIIVSADKDLYQCLNVRTSMYNPFTKAMTTLQTFKEEYGILPPEWAIVKAMAGCSSDSVKGLPGIGEKTAIKYLTHAVPYGSKSHIAITSKEGAAIWRRNLELVRLPLESLIELETVRTIKKNEVSQRKWNEVAQSIGAKSLIKKPKPSFGFKVKKVLNHG